MKAKIVILVTLVLMLTGCSSALSEEYVEHITISQDLIDENEYIKALEEIEHAIEINPEAPEAYLQKGFVQLVIGKTEEAIAPLTYVEEHIKDFKEEENVTQAYLNLGNLYYQLEDYNQALEYFEKVLEEDKNNSDLYNSIGLTYMGLGDFDNAKDAYSMALNADSSNFYVYGNMASLFYAQEEYDAGLNEINTALGMNQSIPQFYLIKGSLLLAKNLEGEALLVYSEALDRWSSFGEAYFERAKLYMKQEEYLKAITDYSNAKDFGILEGVLGMGYAYEGLEQYNEAIQAFSEYMVQLEAIDLKAVYEIAFSNFQIGNYSETVNAIDELLNYEPSDVEAMMLKALAYEKMMEINKAKEVFEMIIEINPEHEEAMEELSKYK